VRPFLSAQGSGRHTVVVLSLRFEVPTLQIRLLWWKYRRAPAVARFASQHGMGYSADRGLDLAAYDFFSLLCRGDRRGCKNVLMGRWQDLPVKEADYWYSELEAAGPQGQQGRVYSYFSIVIADLAADVPYASIHKKGLLTRAAEHLGLHHIDFGSEEFDRKFRVTSPSTDFTFKLIDAGMMQWLLSTGGEFGFEVAHGYLLVWCHLLRPTELMQLFEAAKSFTDHIPGEVWAQYGTNSRGGTPTG
jgi:hypothetical protein